MFEELGSFDKFMAPYRTIIVYLSLNITNVRRDLSAKLGRVNLVLKSIVRLIQISRVSIPNHLNF